MCAHLQGAAATSMQGLTVAAHSALPAIMAPDIDATNAAVTDQV